MRLDLIILSLFFRALDHLEHAVELQEEVLDTHEELILAHQAMAVILKELGRDEEAEKEMPGSGGRMCEKAGFLAGVFTHFMDWQRKRIEED